jgi:hypothetical protein
MQARFPESRQNVRQEKAPASIPFLNRRLFLVKGYDAFKAEYPRAKIDSGTKR